jgi:hypothetical protein
LAIIVFIIAGLLAGAGVGLVGLSAATIITPILVAVLKMSAYKAIGIALISDVLAASISSFTYFKHKNINIKNGIIMMISTLIFTYLFSFLAKDIPNNVLGGAAIFSSGILGFKFLFKPVKSKEELAKKEMSKKKQFIMTIIWGAFIGIICGTIGAGGGLMILLVLTSVLSYDLKTAIGTSVFIMAFTALTGGIAHISQSGTDIPALIICSVSALISSTFLSRIANKIDNTLLNKIVGVFLIVFAVVLTVIRFF